jgi:hypothetical protein
MYLISASMSFVMDHESTKNTLIRQTPRQDFMQLSKTKRDFELKVNSAEFTE